MTAANINILNRKSIRHPEHDYSLPDFYFVTICVKNFKCVLGNIRDEKVILNEIGIIVKNEWLKTPKIRKIVKLHEFVIMPNHLHGIIEIINPVGIDGDQSAIDNNGIDIYQSLRMNQSQKIHKYGPQLNNLFSIIRGFKSASTKYINEKYGLDYFRWQSRFHDRIIRDEKEFNNICQYIADNPLKWATDRNNPKNR